MSFSNVGAVKVRLYSATNPSWSIVVDARLDTGAARTSIDIVLADFLRLPTVGSVKTRSANGRGKREIADLRFVYERIEYITDVSLRDREGMNYPMILGRDVLE